MGPEPTDSDFAVQPLELDAIRRQLVAHTSFSGGRELAETLVPTGEYAEALRLQQETAEGIRVSRLKPSLSLGGVHDVRPLAGRAGAGGMLQPDELLAISSTIRAASTWRRSLSSLGADLPRLAEIGTALLSDHTFLATEIDGAIDDAGELRDGASPALGRIRAELRGARERLVARLRQLMTSAPFKDLLQDPVVTERSGRFVIPLRAEGGAQGLGVVHDQSASGATLFVEPLATVEMGNRWRTLEAEERTEVERLLRALSDHVGAEASAITRSVSGLAALDLIVAKGNLAAQHRAQPPELLPLPAGAPGPVLRLIQARHPLLVGEVVPLTLELGGAFTTLVVTGSNTGGKTVVLKTAGLLVLMAQSGLYVPAEDGTRIGIFQNVGADIGDEQSLQQSLSTFSSHVRRIIRSLGMANDRSLVLLDELGAGTDPQEGAALAQAILEHLRRAGAFVIATTHSSELKAYAQSAAGVENASVEFDLRTLSPTYHLRVGVPGRSHGLAIAERLGMPDDIVAAARTLEGPQTAQVESLLGDIVRQRADAALAQQRIELDRAGASRMLRAAHAALMDAEQKRGAIWREARAEAEQELSRLRREALDIRQKLLGATTRVEAEEILTQAVALPSLRVPAGTAAAESSPATNPEHVRPGELIVVPRLGVPGRVLAVRPDEVELDVSGRRVRVPTDEIAGSARATRAQRREVDLSTLSAVTVSLSAPPEPVSYDLDLRGTRRDEAIERLESFLSDASQTEMPRARVIHGKASGTLRQAVRDVLRHSPLVSRFSPELDNVGGDGATLVWLSA